MRIFLGVTDKEWFDLHASRGHVEEVNFRRPAPTATFKALGPGELMLFKLHAPDNFVVGGRVLHQVPAAPCESCLGCVSRGHGTKSLEAMRARVAYYRRSPMAPNENPTIGCILLAEPFFWPRDLWVPPPADFELNTVQGKGYEAEAGQGRALWTAVEERLRLVPAAEIQEQTATLAAIESHGFGKPQIVLPRLGQGSFRIAVTDAYEQRFAFTGE
jgi:putative restriction endonuclease